MSSEVSEMESYVSQYRPKVYLVLNKDTHSMFLEFYLK